MKEMSPYHNLVQQRRPNKLAYALLITVLLSTFIVNLFIFLEIYYFLNFLKNDKLIHNLSRINLESMFEIFNEVKVNDIKSILGKITESDVEQFFFGIEQCIVQQCYHK
jgi:hypothetical protein